MEPGIKEFFRRLAASIGMFIFWMAINMVIGIKLGYAFYDDTIRAGNIVFYFWAIISFAALIYFYIWLWKRPIENLTD